VATGPALVIAAPALTPPPNGLLRAATVIEHDELHFGSALEWSPEGCGSAQVVDPCAVTDKGSAGNRPANIRYDAFVVEAHDACSTFGWQAADYDGRARRAIVARESKAVEAEYWSGTLKPANPHLAKPTSSNGPAVTTLAGGAAQSLRLGLALLAQSIADGNGGTGMIHARPFLVELWWGLDLLYRDAGGRLLTGNGNLVVPGSGYPGTGPNGEAITASSEWAYATDEVIVHRGPVFTPTTGVNGQSMDRALNEVISRAERPYALAVNGCVLSAVNINPGESS
jgi:hypothetical protein